MIVPSGRCNVCYHPLDSHSRLYRATGAGAGETVIRCRVVTKHGRCDCERPALPTAAHGCAEDDDGS